jgi:hypothetical protein
VISNGGRSDFTRSSGGGRSRTSSSSRRRRNSRGRRSIGASGFFAAANSNNNTAGAGSVLPTQLAQDSISTSLSPGPASSSSRSDVGGNNGDDNPSSSCGGGNNFDDMGIITTNHYPPITIPLSDILDVDEDRPTATSTTTATSSSMYRIFLRSSTQGYFEFSTESNNSHDVCMAFLLAHLPHDRIVKSSRQQQQKGGPHILVSNNNTKQHGENTKLRRVSSATGVGMMLRTMVLTPTKQFLDDNNNIVLTPPPPRIVTSLDDIPPPPPIPLDDYPRIRSCPSSPTHKISISSSTLSSCRSNAIDKLQTKVIQQHLRDYESSSVDTPLTRLVLKGKELADRVRNNILDCQLCCVDTTTVTPLATAAESRDDGGSAILGGRRGDGGGGIITNDGKTIGMKYQMMDDHYHNNKSTNKKSSSSSPNTETLRNRGIGGLSFEVESCSGLSWERSVGM